MDFISVLLTYLLTYILTHLLICPKISWLSTRMVAQYVLDNDSLPTLFIVVTTIASSAIPSVYCRTSLVSRSSIRSLELLAIGHSVTPIPVFLQRLKTFLFRKSFIHILLWHFCSHRTRSRGLRNSFTIWTTGSPLVIEVEDTEDSKPKDGRRWSV